MPRSARPTPRASKQTKPPPKNRCGRPKRDIAPRRAMNLRIELEIIDWMQTHLPRSIHMSDFINEVLREKITILGK